LVLGQFQGGEHDIDFPRPNEQSFRLLANSITGYWLLAAVQDATTNNEPCRHYTGVFQGHIVHTGTLLKTTNGTRRSALSKFSAWFRLMGWMCLVVGTAYWPAHIC